MSDLIENLKCVTKELNGNPVSEDQSEDAKGFIIWTFDDWDEEETEDD